ncbi:TBC domain-containing protein [Cryptosporidium muris RN66]|uniref:TBC domain-containing protein n=1 Tax=Cryptosporidium muris (strain RN66) TaxID=441375 RepID=B6AJV0_CRYMR|nr:TBC domain-containing protein [Cryptosporidium muris RN66]EEA08491.1 TBC domain-containing protein [Cryptosporidium muris RN66]|eukprot:XP_002142840.1 TBC domain-containing protein [Cryptosporidium muris RN66]
MATNKEGGNLISLLAAKRAYNFFLPELNNKTTAKNFEFTVYSQWERLQPHCKCERDEFGRCKRFLSWLDTGGYKDINLNDIYSDITNLFDHLTRLGTGLDISIKKKTSSEFSGENLLNRIFSYKIMNSIYMDVCRTYPSITFFREEGRYSLSRILLVYSIFDLQVGYVQGMNFLVGCILWHSHSEELVFYILVCLMFNYGMREMYIAGLPGLQIRCKILDEMIEKELPLIWYHMNKQGGTIDMLATDWFLTLFSYSIPLDIIGYFWDDIFEQGWLPVFKLILYRLQRLEDRILDSHDIADMMNIIKYSTPTSKNGIVSNILGVFKDEFGKTALGKWINNIGNTSSNNNIDNMYAAFRSQPYALTNDPNTIALPQVWLELVTEAPFEINLTSKMLLDIENKVRSCIECNDSSPLSVNLYRVHNINTVENHYQEESREVDESLNRKDIPTNIKQNININDNIEKERSHNTLNISHYNEIIEDLYKQKNIDLNISNKISDIFTSIESCIEVLLQKSNQQEHLQKLINNSRHDSNKLKFGPWINH